MSIPASPEVLSLEQDLLAGMVSHMQGEDEDDFGDRSGFDAGYIQEDIDRCAAIIDHCLISLAKPAGEDRDETIMDEVKETVLELNALNHHCGGHLIGSEQREILCELLLTAAHDAGLDTDLDDITEAWREW